MCGINGILYNKPGKTDIESHLTRMNNLIVHRGPDDDGTHFEYGRNYSLALGMRRLSIIDLHTGKQPIYNKDESLIIVFNGEIYNYQKLKKSLEQQGVIFKTKSDTEVILKLYETYGSESFEYLDGMYAFSILDKTKGKLIIARDFFGEKPLYYTKTNDGLIWASELKSITPILSNRPEISKHGLNLYFKLTYIPAPFTIYEGIYKLEANSLLEYDLNTHEYNISTINHINHPETTNYSLEEASKKLHDLVMDSVSSRSVADVPLGTFLSGGVDSSIVSLGLSKINDKKIETFSIGFKKSSFDESDKSRLVAKLINSNHHEFIIDENDISQYIDQIILNFDEPFADSSALPTYLVANKTREFVKVALTGDGGDEVFGGYNKYYMGRLNANYTKFVPSKLHKTLAYASKGLLSSKQDERGLKLKVRKFISSVNYQGEYYWDIISLGFGKDTQLLLNSTYLFNAPFLSYKRTINHSLNDDIHMYREIDRHVSLEGDMLVKVDRTSMLNSLECRAPFLNKSLWEFSNNLPSKYLINGWDKKYILKEAFKNEFPKGFLDHPKKGFVVPVGDWLRSHLRPELEKYANTGYIDKQGIFNKEFLSPILNNHLSGKEDNTYKVWTYFVFQKWYNHIYDA